MPFAPKAHGVLTPVPEDLIWQESRNHICRICAETRRSAEPAVNPSLRQETTIRRTTPAVSAIRRPYPGEAAGGSAEIYALLQTSAPK